MNADRLGKRYSITVCMDGHVSILDTQDKRKQRRHGSALPVFTVDDILDAFALIEKVCTLSRCDHGPKIGTLLEPRVIGWPDLPSIDRDLERVGAWCEEEYEKMLKERGAA